MMRRGDRFLTAITFLLLGPLVGGLWLLGASSIAEYAGGAPNGIWDVWDSVAVAIGFSYIAGFLPAFLTGIIYAALPSAWQRVVISLLIGGSITWLLWEWLQRIFPGHSPSPRSAYVMVVGAGVAAAGVSAFVARQILRLMGREYDHSGGVGGPVKERTE